MTQRVFGWADFAKAGDPPPRNPVLENTHAAVVVWCAQPGQTIAAHRHLGGQDTWVVVQGSGEYLIGDGQTLPIKAGTIAVALPEQVHGVRNTGDVDLVFVSVVAPQPAGYDTREA